MAKSHDIADRKQAEEELRRSEASFRSLVENAPYGIVRSTLEGRIVMANPAFVRMLGYDSEADLCAHNMRDLYRDPGERQRLVIERWKNSIFRDLQLEWKRKDGRFITVNLTGGPVLAPDGAIDCFEVFAEDITERRLLERQLFQSQKMEAIGRLAGGIAHDFNNLLGVIMGHTELLLEQAAPDSRLRRSIDAIQGAAERAGALTMQLLAFSRKQIVDPKILDVNLSLRELEKLLRRVIGEDVELILRLQPELRSIRIDPGQFDQILMNLVVNGRDALPRGGKLILETRDVTLDDSYVAAHMGSAAGQFVLLTVSDTGIGMDPETLSRIFEPFFTTKEKGKGTGLGLSTVYGIVKQAGGYIMAYSEPGRGSTFKVYFPSAAGVPAASGSRETSAEVPGGKETILLVEDETDLRELTRDLLAASGYTVLEAPNPADALRIVADAPPRIDLLLTDVVMPGMDGQELAGRLTARWPGLKVLFMSGYADEVIAHRGVLARGTLLVQKPFARALLLRKIREALGR